jgi:hypothetical protein
MGRHNLMKVGKFFHGVYEGHVIQLGSRSLSLVGCDSNALQHAISANQVGRPKGG